MTPFQSLRLWLRRAPRGERAFTAASIAVAVALLAWVAAPEMTPRSAGVTTTGSGESSSRVPGVGVTGTIADAAAGASASPGSRPVTAVAQQPSAASTGRAADGATSRLASRTGVRRHCISPPGADTGISATQIRVAIAVSNIVGPAGNETVGIPSADEQEQDYQQVIDAVNATGGVACRRLVPTFYKVNPADQNDLQSTCMTIVSSDVFAELDPSNYADFPQRDCFAQHGLPFFTSYFLPAADLERFYPYNFAFDSLESLYHNTVFALRDRGFFTAADGFKKLGFVYRDCLPSLVRQMTAWLRQAGLTSSQIVGYDVGCPTAFAAPSDIEQAVLTFQRNGVTHVTAAQFEGYLPQFTTTAQQQGFHPKYGLGDEAIISTSYGTRHPDYTNINGAIAVTASRFGEERTPGMSPTPATKSCNAIYRSHGRPPVYQQKGGFAGYICNEIWMFAAAVEHAPALRRTALAAGLQAAHSVDFSWPEGPNDFSGNRITYAGQYWRTAVFRASCDCWQVLDRRFHPSYQ